MNTTYAAFSRQFPYHVDGKLDAIVLDFLIIMLMS